MVITTITASRLMLGGFALLVIEPGIKSTVRQKMDQLRRYQLNNLNSDQLRRQLDENNAAMNTLADNNQKIVELLSLRGLKAINSSSDLAEIRALLEPERRADAPLTTDELEAGGWWCADASEDCRSVLVSNGVDTDTDNWNYIGSVRCALKSSSLSSVIRASFRNDELKQIHRIGNEFYWGAP